MLAAAGFAGLAVLSGPCGCASKESKFELDIPESNVDRAAARALALKAQKAEKADEPERAIELYRQALETDPDAPAQWWNNLGALLLSRHPPDYVNAATAFKAAAALDLDDPRPRINLGMVYYEAAHGNEALDAFEEALALDPGNLDALRAAVRSQRQLKRTDQASLDRAKQGLLIESDPVWREIFLREKIRLENLSDPDETSAGR
jgi:tetratricopeptide (TPR) repeat protein